MLPTFDIDIAENNSSGGRTKRFSDIQIYDGVDCIIHLEHRQAFGKEAIRHHDNHIEIAGFKIPHKDVDYWSGNRLWNSYEGISAAYVLALLNLLMQGGRFSVTEAIVPLAEKWEKKQPFTAADFDIDEAEGVEPIEFNPNQLDMF